jgi:uncharacterized protein YukE
VSTENPLVAAKADTPVDPWAGVWIAEDIEQLCRGVKDGSWIDGTLGAVSAGLDALAFVSDPIGALLQYGVAWIIEHVKPLSEALDWLAGDPGQIAAHAQTWRNVAGALHERAADLDRAVRWDVTEWTGSAADAYRSWVGQQKGAVGGMAQAAETLATITEAAGLLVAGVRLLVRDAIAVLVSRLIVYAAEELASFGLATPLVVEQVSTLCASWAARIGKWLKDLVSSLSKLRGVAGKVGELIEKLKELLGRRGHGKGGGKAASTVRQTGGELRRPRGDIDFEFEWADQAYDRIRAGDDEIPAIAETAHEYGFTTEDIAAIKNHVFREEHLLDSYGESTLGRFDANPRMAEAWQRLADGNPHPADIDLLRHERFEAEFMATTGDQSYRQAHAATNAAGYTWDPEAAARDGAGYQRQD